MASICEDICEKEQIFKALLSNICWHDAKEIPEYKETSYLIIRENGFGGLELEIAMYDSCAGWLTQDDPNDWGSWCGPVKGLKRWGEI